MHSTYGLQAFGVCRKLGGSIVLPVNGHATRQLHVDVNVR